MKLVPLINENSKMKLKMIITTEQLHSLAKSVISEQEQGTIKNTHLIKINTNEKKK